MIFFISLVNLSKFNFSFSITVLGALFIKFSFDNLEEVEEKENGRGRLSLLRRSVFDDSGLGEVETGRYEE